MKKLLLILGIILLAVVGYSQQSLVDAQTIRARTRMENTATTGTVNRGVRFNASNFQNDMSMLDVYPISGLNTSVGTRWVPRGTGRATDDKVALDLYGTDYLLNQVNYERYRIHISSGGIPTHTTFAGGSGTIRPIYFNPGGVNVLQLSNANVTFSLLTGTGEGMMFLDASGNAFRSNRFTSGIGYNSAIDFNVLATNDFVTKGHIQTLADSIHIQGITTTGNTATNLDTIYIPDGYMAVVDMTMTADNTANDEVLSGQKTITIKRVGSTYTVIGTIQTRVADQAEASVSTATWTASVTGSIPVIRVTGIAATNIAWEVHYTKTYKQIN